MHVHTSASLRVLAEKLAEMLKSPSGDPFEPEWVAVPSAGVRRWLSLELAAHLGAAPRGADGVTANIAMPFPGALRARVLDAGRPKGQPDPWQIDRMVWTVLSALRKNSDDPALAAVAKDHEGVPAYSKARRIADLFDRYHVHRPEMVRAWAADRDVDADGTVMSPAHPQTWQPRLWREVRAKIGGESPPERLSDLLQLLEEGRLDIDLPNRLSLFGLTVLPGGGGFLELSRAVAAHREVHLFMQELAPLTEMLREISGDSVQVRNVFDETSADAIKNPLLQSWGRLQRETAMLLTVYGTAEPGGERVRNESAGIGADARRGTILSQLQADISANAAPYASVGFDGSDPSVRFHACHGPTRQVEVLRDAILHLLADERLGIGEDDILVACPSLDRFAPLIEAVFGPSAPGAGVSVAPDKSSGAPSLRYRIADRSLRDVNVVLSAMSDLLDLVSGRFEASSVLDFLSLLPVRTRSRFSEDELARITEWVGDANVRWGIDPPHRSGFGFPTAITTNTWRSALDRLLLGSAVFDDLGLGIGETAVIGVEGGDVDVVGRLAEVLDRLAGLAHEAAESRPVAEWVELLRAATDELFEMPRDFEWQLNALRRLFDDIVESASPLSQLEAGSERLTFAELRRVFRDRLRAAPGRPEFFRGGITVTSLTPLRGVPFRAVFLLGMDERAFRAPMGDGDDLATVTASVGDPDRRAEDRLSVLQLIMAAEDHLALIRDGRDVRTNQLVPPAVVVEELREALESTVRASDVDEFRASLEVMHPRQAFDDRCFASGMLIRREPWGFGEGDLAGAQARRERLHARPAFLRERLTPLAEEGVGETIELQQLHDFLRDPVKAFVQNRLEALLPGRNESAGDLLPVAADGLEKWKIGDRLLSALWNEGVDPEQWTRVERRRGSLPPAALGDEVIGAISATVMLLVEEAEQHGMRRGPAEDVSIDVNLGDGTRIVGSVPSRLADPWRGPARVFYSSFKPYHKLAAWLDLMALAAMSDESPCRSLLVNRKSGEKPACDVVDLIPIAPDGDIASSALRALEVIVRCYRLGRLEPMPFFPNFSHQVYLGKANKSDWTGAYQSRADGDAPAALLAFGHLDYLALMDLPPGPDDPRGAGPRISLLANYVYGALDRSVGPLT